MSINSLIRHSICWLLFFFSIVAVFAQNAVISGKIQSLDSLSIANAQVLLQGTNFSAYSNKQGRFVIENVPYGKYTLIAFAFEKELKSIPITVNQPNLIQNITLTELSVEVDEIIIQSEKKKTFGLERLKSVDNFGIYAGKKTEVIVLEDINANLATNNPRQVFAKITGLNIWESDGAGLQLGIGGRGLSPNRSANFNTRQNGYDISADALGYPESYYTPPTEALEKIEVIRGASSLQYGTQFGGMLNFKFKKGPEDKKIAFTSRQSAGSWGFFGTFNSIGGTIAKGKLNYYAYYQYKRGDGYRPNSRFNYHNGYVSLQYKVSKKVTLNTDFTKMYYLAKQAGGLTDKMFEENPKQSVRNRNWFKVNWNLLAITLTYNISERTQINIRNFGLLANRQSLGNLERINVTDIGQDRTMISGKFKNFGTEARFLHRYSMGKNINTFLVGFRYYEGHSTAQQGNANNGSGPDFKYLNPEKLEDSDYKFPSRNAAVFVEHIFQVHPKVSITPGLRFEHIQTFADGYYRRFIKDFAGNIVFDSTTVEEMNKKRSFVIGGLGVSYKPNSKVEIYTNFSQNYRAINFTDIRIQNPNFIVDPNIKDEKGFTADIGVRGNIQDKITYELTLFAVKYNGRIGQILRADKPPLYIDYRFRGNISDARNLGVESFVEADLFKIFGKNIEGFSWTVFNNFAFVDARYVNTDDSSIRGKKVEMAPPIMLRSGTTVRYKPFSFTFQFNYTSEHYSDATNAVLTPTSVEGLIPSYKVADISMSYTWKMLTAEASCNNLFNEQYFTRRAEAYPGPGIIPSDGRGFYFTLMLKI